MLIYCITNLKNNKKYIGQTIRSLKERFIEHWCSANSREKFPLYCSMRKYGKENFKIEQIDTADSLDELNEKEIYWIQELNTLSPNGYNLREGGNSGGTLHPSLIERLRRKNLGKKHSEEAKQKCRLTRLGKHNSEEHNEKIRQSLLGKKHSEGRKKKNRDWHLEYYKNGGRHARGMLGKTFSEEVKQKKREEMKQKWQDPAYRQMMLDRRRKSNVKD